MTNPCELVARLNPGAARLDGGGRGGIPEITPQDIAAALGMVSDTLAREVFCAVWWPDGARLMWKELDSVIAALQFERWRVFADAMITAQIAAAEASIRTDPGSRAAQERADGMLERARDAMWPSLVEEPYRLIRAAVIAEMRASRACPLCNGRGSVKTETLIVTCHECGGGGRIAVSDVQRAKMLSRNESSYRRTWKPVYEWTFGEVVNAEHKGRLEFEGRLGLAA